MVPFAVTNTYGTLMYFFLTSSKLLIKVMYGGHFYSLNLFTKNLKK